MVTFIYFIISGMLAAVSCFQLAGYWQRWEQRRVGKVQNRSRRVN